jgi:hypothetical protein
MATLFRLRFVPLLFLIWLGVESGQAQDWNENLQIHGYASQGFLFSSKNNYLTTRSSQGSLQWTDGVISVTDSVTDKLRVGMQFHMYQLGQLGGSQVELDWASGDYRLNDQLGFRAGKIKTVFGLFTDSQDVEPIFLWVLLPQSLYPIDNRDYMLSELGGEIYGRVNLGRGRGALRYHAQGGEAYLEEDEGYMQQLAGYGLTFDRAPAGSIWGGDLRWETPIRGWSVGASAVVQDMNGTAEQGAVRVTRFFSPVYYSQFERGKWFFAGEYNRAPVNPTLFFGTEGFAWPLDQRSWYLMGSYRVTDKLQVGTYYSHYVNRAADTALRENYSKDWVIAGRYDFNSFLYGKVEGHFLQGTGLGYYSETNPNGLQTNSRILAARIGFTF